MSIFKNKRRATLLCIDAAILVLVYAGISVFSLLTHEYSFPKFLVNFFVYAVAIFSARAFASVYKNVWRYANAKSYIYVVVSDFAGGIVALSLCEWIGFLKNGVYGWRGVAFVAVVNVATLFSRFFYQTLYMHYSKYSDLPQNSHKIRVAIIGAGHTGALLAEELIYNSDSHYYPICFVDNNKDKIGKRVLGVNVYADDDDIVQKIKDLAVQEIFIALPRMNGEQTKRLLGKFSKTGCKIKLYDFPMKNAGGSPSRRVVREVRIEDLLFRDSIDVADSKMVAFYADKTILVTGGGGSIGSELCRQIAKCSPKKLIIFDIYENNAYDIQQELRRKYADKLNLVVEIGSVRDRARLNAVFSYYKPDVVFHAAAHKHVPLMEHSNAEAIKNNVIGTYNTADMAELYGVKKFILVSTDKAVNPTNVMGASKRLCEMVVQCRTDSKTAFAAVRFGNVLGSNGSVVPLFRRQIVEGGPITLTDKRIIRYFMTIPEASGLVMQAGAMANAGDLFVLDMGKPVKILELAENIIRLSNLRPYIDIDIVETGLRPGEKLYEELLIKTENLTKTENNLIFIEHDTPLSRADVDEKLEILKTAVASAENEIGAESIKIAMKSVVPTFHDPSEVNRTAENAEEMKLVSES